MLVDEDGNVIAENPYVDTNGGMTEGARLNAQIRMQGQHDKVRDEANKVGQAMIKLEELKSAIQKGALKDGDPVMAEVQALVAALYPGSEKLVVNATPQSLNALKKALTERLQQLDWEQQQWTRQRQAAGDPWVEDWEPPVREYTPVFSEDEISRIGSPAGAPGAPAASAQPAPAQAKPKLYLPGQSRYSQ